MLLAGAAIPAYCEAQAVAWAHQNGSLASNGSISIKSQSGGSYAGQVNPAGAVAKANQSAVTQPPTIIVQATASLPIKSPGDPCTPSTTGAAPNQSATEGNAITLDRTSFLTCQSGLWKRQPVTGELDQCDGVYNGATIITMCVNIGSGQLTYTSNGNPTVVNIGSGNWPADWATGSTKAYCGAWYNNAYIGVSCLAPSTKLWCYNSNGNQTWVCTQKT